MAPLAYSEPKLIRLCEAFKQFSDLTCLVTTHASFLLISPVIDASVVSGEMLVLSERDIYSHAKVSTGLAELYARARIYPITAEKSHDCPELSCFELRVTGRVTWFSSSPSLPLMPCISEECNSGRLKIRRSLDLMPRWLCTI